MAVTREDPLVQLARQLLTVATDELIGDGGLLPGTVDPDRAIQLAQTAALVSIAQSLDAFDRYAGSGGRPPGVPIPTGDKD